RLAREHRAREGRAPRVAAAGRRRGDPRRDRRARALRAGVARRPPRPPPGGRDPRRARARARRRAHRRLRVRGAPSGRERRDRAHGPRRSRAAVPRRGRPRLVLALALGGDRAPGRRTVAVLGEMAELGPDAPRFHREVDTAGIDVVVGVGELARAYDPDEWAATAGEAAELVRELVRPGDVVLVKGSRSVGLERVADALAGAVAP